MADKLAQREREREKEKGRKSYVGENERERGDSKGWDGRRRGERERESVSVLLVASMPLGLYTTFNDNTFLRSLSGHYCRPLKISSQHLFGK